MTTYQDQPLQSRRAIRQGERPEQSSPPFAPPQTPRTAAGAEAGEPLNYVTQNRPPLPGYDAAPAAHGRRSSEPEAAPEAAAEQQPEAAPQQGFRPRDYRPEARTAPPAWAPEHDRGVVQDHGVVEYRTQARANVEPPASLAASLAGEPSEQTFTRRELRALRDAHGITVAPPTETTPVIPEQVAPPAPVAPQQFAPQPAAFPQPAPAAPPVQSAPPAPAPSTQLDSAMAEFDALTARNGAPAAPPAEEAPPRRAGRRAAPQSEATPEDGLGAFEAFATPAAPVAPAPVAPAAQEPVAPAPVAPAPAPERHAVVLPPEPAPMAPAAFEPVAPITGERPVGHWTTQSELDDRTQVNESTISRTIGSGAITTSALVLPSLPGHDMTTGEVLLTGSVSLPSSLAATGAHHSIDESDLDHLLDPGDHQAVNTDSVPIRAIRAVSSHTNSQNPLLANAKSNRGGRALTALIVSASVMVVVVVTLLVVALVTEVL